MITSASNQKMKNLMALCQDTEAEGCREEEVTG